MKRLLALILLLSLVICTVSCSNGGGLFGETACSKHTDANDDGQCDKCAVSVLSNFDFYAVNDLHGKFADTEVQSGVDEMTSYLKNAQVINPNTLVLSIGDMWQGSAESNLTKGNIITEWMNDVNFVSMNLGNHEYDWGEEPIEQNSKLAEFPFLGINIYDRETNKRVDYCKPSLMVEKNGVKIGIIGAMGDCYSSIASEMSEGVYFVTGKGLTDLVQAESRTLKEMGADFIIYTIHDGYGGTNYDSTMTDSMLSGFYDVNLSNGYVDLVFEAHTHKYYVKTDKYGVYHLQGGGDNLGITHVDVDINTANGNFKVINAEYLRSSTYSGMTGDPIVEQLMQKYDNQIGKAKEVLGKNAYYRDSRSLRNIVARLYYEAGQKKWGKDYNIVLGGGFLTVRSPGHLQAGDVTYGNLQMLLPFDNQLTLCSIKGSYLKWKFLETDNSNYFIYCGDYGESVKDNIDPNATYYVIVDSYTSTYGPNRLTEIARYDAETFARDLLAEYIKTGGLD